jgi:tetratricopeptide (TPR) repeat protein
VHHGKSAKLSPGNADYQVNQGMAYFKLKKYPLAKTSWTQALQISPKHKRAAKYLRMIEKKLGK